MAHAQKPDFVFWRNGRVHLNRRVASVQSTTGSRGVCISGTNAGYTMFLGSVKSTGYSNRHYLLHFLSHTSPCAITFQLDSTSAPPIGVVLNWTVLPSPLPFPANVWSLSFTRAKVCFGTSVERSRSKNADTCLTAREIPRLLYNLTRDDRIHRGPTLRLS
jgi:hypothetical protein